MIDACTVCGKPAWQCNVFVRYQGEGFCSLLCGVKSRFADLFATAPRVHYVALPIPEPAVVISAPQVKACRNKPKRKKRPKNIAAKLQSRPALSELGPIIHSSLDMEISTRQIVEAIKERYEQ